MTSRRLDLIGALVPVVIAVLVLVALSIGLPAVGTTTVTRVDVGGTLQKITIAWTSTAGGAVSGNTFLLKRLRIRQVKFIPGSAGTQPSDLYDVTLVDASGVDLLFGAGADRSNATSSIVRLDPSPILETTSTVDLVVANAGSAKTGTVILWVE